MKNVHRDENSPVEMIEGRLMILHTKGIDARNRLKLREEKGVGGREKQRQLGSVGMNTVEKNLELILRMGRMMGST